MLCGTLASAILAGAAFIRSSKQKAEARIQDALSTVKDDLNKRIDDVRDNLKEANRYIHQINHSLGQVTGLLKGISSQADKRQQRKKS